MGLAPVCGCKQAIEALRSHPHCATAADKIIEALRLHEVRTTSPPSMAPARLQHAQTIPPDLPWSTHPRLCRRPCCTRSSTICCRRSRCSCSCSPLSPRSAPRMTIRGLRKSPGRLAASPPLPSVCPSCLAGTPRSQGRRGTQPRRGCRTLSRPTAAGTE